MQFNSAKIENMHPSLSLSHFVCVCLWVNMDYRTSVGAKSPLQMGDGLHVFIKDGEALLESSLKELSLFRQI